MARAYFAAITLCLAGTASAQNQTGRDSDETLISGVISPTCTVEVLNPEVRVDVAVRSGQEVTAIIYTCNSVGGITRQMMSQNAGALVRGNQAIPYFLSEDGNSRLAFAPVRLLSPLVTQVASFPQLTHGAHGVLSVAVPTLPPRLLAGEYSDTITIEIVPN